MIKKSQISIPLTSISNELELFIYEEFDGTLYEISEIEADEFGEAKYQLLEGRNYNYYFNDNNYQLQEQSGIVINSKRKDVSEGRITPNIYVGTLTLFLTKKDDPLFENKIYVEVLATKMNSDIDKSYRENYRFMLDSITEKCTELLMQINAPISQNYEIDFENNNKTIYQRFAFVQSLIGSNEFNEAIQKIISSPTTQWKNDLEQKDIRSIRRFNNSNIRQLASVSNRFKLPDEHFLAKKYSIKDVPSKILSTRKVETIDTNENRFIKHAIEVFLKFLNDCSEIFNEHNYLRAQKEVRTLITKLENHLNHPFFKEISRPNTLKLNSPVLQRKSGYREILNAWLKFDLAAKLIWKGGDDVYNAGKRDIAVLYEYWLFFTLYDLIKERFNLNQHQFGEKPYEHLIIPTNDGLNVMVKSGKHTALEGIFNSGKRKLKIKFSYNRTFSGGTDYNNKKAGSWTKTLRPDYTLSVWPADINEPEAEEKELIVHIHFDSKYKVDQYVITTEIDPDLINSDGKDILEQEKEEERKGNYKNADLLKMHAYKDAIRRTGGAYILYPGTEAQKPLKGFHELIPGLGAFAVRPKEGENGTSELIDFIDKIIAHFNNMASQQRRHSNKVYEIHKDESPKIINEPMPEYIIPNETYVIVAYYKSKEHLEWIKREMKYNGRIGNTKGAMDLTPEFIGAKYLLLHNKNETGSVIFKINQKELEKPRVLASNELKNYPDSKHPFYLVFNLEEKEKDFLNNECNFKQLPGYSEDKDAFPFTCSLAELLKVV
jgi:predicted component of viral defense system (DUF524 family)